jgi:heme-degrading monooxygenase HmoA
MSAVEAAMNRWHIAQMNVGTTLYPLDDARIAEFVARLDEVNALAEASPGFVWRLQSASGNATDIKVSDDPNFIVNMSVWASAEALFDFVYKSSHRLVMAKRREWFVRPPGAYMVLWWIAAGMVPTVAEGLARLGHLDAHGPSAEAFTFRERFPPPGGAGLAEDLYPDPYCVGWR